MKKNGEVLIIGAFRAVLKGLVSFIQYFIFIDISKAEVIAHYNWVLEYRHLKEMQNKSLEVWKALREAHKYHKTTLKDSQKGDGAKIKEHKKITNDSPYSKVMLEIWKNNKEKEKNNVENKFVSKQTSLFKYHSKTHRATISPLSSSKKADQC